MRNLRDWTLHNRCLKNEWAERLWSKSDVCCSCRRKTAMKRNRWMPMECPFYFDTISRWLFYVKGNLFVLRSLSIVHVVHVRHWIHTESNTHRSSHLLKILSTPTCHSPSWFVIFFSKNVCVIPMHALHFVISAHFRIACWHWVWPMSICRTLSPPPSTEVTDLFFYCGAQVKHFIMCLEISVLCECCRLIARPGEACLQATCSSL